VADHFTIAHLTDAHLAQTLPRGPECLGKRGLSRLSWRRRRSRLHRRDIAEAVAADVRAAGADAVMMTGDAVNFALDAEFAGARAWLGTLGPPDIVGLIPGNHEALAAGMESAMRAHWGAYLLGDDGAPEFPWLRRRGPVALIGVSSAVATPPFFASGRVGASQIARLRAILAQTGAEGLCRVVAVHHPPTPITIWRKRLEDGPAFRAVLAEAGAELVIHGHTHFAEMSWIDGRAGRIPVLGAPACGLLPGPRNDAGGWRALEIARVDAGWRLTMRERRVGEDGTLADATPLSFALPGVRVACARRDV
jgi:3',5'-cyclic AMP phosphodiesterase CpdA